MATYKGTQITGTSTSPKEFHKLNIPGKKVWFYVDDTYTNTKTGHVYRCTTAGYDKPTKKYPNYSKWAYDHTEVLAKPNKKVTDMTAPTRGSNNLVFTSKWKVQSDLTDSKNCRRCNKLRVTRAIEVENSKMGTGAAIIEDENTSAASAAVNVNNFRPNVKSIISAFKGPFDRESFYPYTSWVLNKITVSVQAVNGKGDGPKATEAVTLLKPNKPTVAMAVDTESWDITYTVTPAADKGRNERARTQYELEICTSSNQTWTKVANKSGHNDGNSAFTVVYDVQNAHQVGAWTMVRFHARSQGLGGASGWTDWQQHTVGWPAVPTMGDPDVKDPNDATSYGYVTVKSNSTQKQPVDRVVLQLLVPGANDDDVPTAAAAKASGDWDDTDSVDDARCKALSFIVGAVSQNLGQGKHAWVRVKAWHDLDGVGGFVTYSEPKELKSFYRAPDPDPTAADDTVVITGTGSGADGESAWCSFAWDRGSDDSDETIVSWSTDSGAWTATKEPSTYTVDDSRATIGNVTYKGQTYHKSFRLTICDLEKGEQVYIRARRHMKENDTYGPFSNTGKAVPTAAPTDVVLSVPPFIAEGSDIPLSWGYGGGGVQKQWVVKHALAGDSSQCAEGGEGPSYCVLPWSEERKHVENGALAYQVSVSTGGTLVTSSAATVKVATRPTLAIGTISSLTAQPLQIPLTCSVSTAAVAIVVSAHGASGAAPDGEYVQTAGDTVHSAVYRPTWTASGGSFAATVELPSGKDFHEGAMYTVEAVATDSVTGLQSETATAEFDVAWAHQAPAPSDAITLEPSVATDADGNTVRSVTIALAAPAGADEDDAYDIYRLTGDGAQIIGRGLALDAQVTDMYAPFGDMPNDYRIALRTADGDMEWLDYEYQLDGPVIRFDFDGDEHSYVELRWDIGASETWAKDFVASKRMDGSKGGSWGASVEHTASYQSDVLHIEEQAVIDAVRDLARTSKPVFVRTGYGTAFAANVDVDGMDLAALGGNGVAVSFKATEVDLTDGFMLPVEPEEETEGA